jgi:PAS domain S-box-containing protein
MTDRREARPRSGVVGRAWADLPLRAKGLVVVVVAIPLLALLLATVLFGVPLAQDRRAQGVVLHTVEVERQIAQVRILVQAGVTGYVLTGERRYLTASQAARQELPRAIAHLGVLVSDNPGQAGRLERAAVLLGEREQALRQAQAMLEHIVAWSPMVMFRGLLGGRGQAHVSDNVERILGCTQEQVLGTLRFWFERLHPADRDRFAEALQRAVAERAPQLEQEYRFLLQDGYRWLYGATRLVDDDDGGELADTLGYAMDVTERRQADEAVREREATLQAVVNASPDIITILDAEGGIRSMSPAVQRILGWPSGERVGRSAFSSDIIHPDDLEPFTEAQRGVLTGQAEHAAVRLRARHADGRWRTLDIHSRPLAASGGVLLVTRDVTEQAALEEELRLAKAAADQANQAKSEYLSRMSHERREVQPRGRQRAPGLRAGGRRPAADQGRRHRPRHPARVGGAAVRPLRAGRERAQRHRGRRPWPAPVQAPGRGHGRHPGPGQHPQCGPSSASTWPPTTTPTWSCSTCTCPTCPARRSCAASRPARGRPGSRWRS